MNYIYFVFVFIIGIAVGYSINDEEEIRPLLSTRVEKKYSKKRALLDEIKKKGTITNDEVEVLLDVSDATATRYLDDLEDIGLIEQKGKGRGVYYEYNN